MVAPTRVTTLLLILAGFIQQVLAFLSGFLGTGATPLVLVFKSLVVDPIIPMAFRIDESLGNNIFPYLILCLVMIAMKHDLLTKFLKMKPLIF